MTITVAEGEAFAARWLKACADGFHNNNNNHRETMKGLLADNVSWSSSDGTKVSRYRTLLQASLELNICSNFLLLLTLQSSGRRKPRRSF